MCRGAQQARDVRELVPGQHRPVDSVHLGARLLGPGLPLQAPPTAHHYLLFLSYCLVEPNTFFVILLPDPTRSGRYGTATYRNLQIYLLRNV